MERRQFVKALVAASMSGKAMLGQSANNPMAGPSAPGTAHAATPAPGPVPWMRGLLDVKPLPVGTLVPDEVAHSNTKFFSEEQMAALRQLCEILLPPLKGNPGAVDAGAPEFLDFLISVSPADRQELYRNGLDRLNRDARKQFGAPFSAVNATQADALIRPALKAWMSDHPPTEPFEQFINEAHADIRTATFNSKEWSDAEVAAGRRPPGAGLYWYPIEPDVEGKFLPRS
ncbi:MAG TPA: gluconate 2-dehydrogenase subunit 3 family protein [Acidobacteriaceae bacterium]|jgi:hypothetical protein|nr:gluconate 2-dehydrogenase subunit 3 family protein [Acidobacteriaceae bacterium]